MTFIATLLLYILLQYCYNEATRRAEYRKLSCLTVAKLKPMAKELGVKGYYKMRKAQLVDAIVKEIL